MSDQSPEPVTPAPGALPAYPPDEAISAPSIRGLRESFGEKVAVDGVTLEVPSGSFHGLVGPNGAGQTTTLSMATSLLRPDAGTALVHDVDV